jgi:hypothetical protein
VGPSLLRLSCYSTVLVPGIATHARRSRALPCVMGHAGGSGCPAPCMPARRRRDSHASIHGRSSGQGRHCDGCRGKYRVGVRPRFSPLWRLTHPLGQALACRLSAPPLLLARSWEITHLAPHGVPAALPSPILRHLSSTSQPRAAPRSTVCGHLLHTRIDHAAMEPPAVAHGCCTDHQRDLDKVLWTVRRSLCCRALP